MKLIPQWKLWWKRHSVQLLSLIPIITVARDNLPMLKGLMPDSVYGYTMAGLAITAAVVMQIQQLAVSGDQS